MCHFCNSQVKSKKKFCKLIFLFLMKSTVSYGFRSIVVLSNNHMKLLRRDNERVTIWGRHSWEPDVQVKFQTELAIDRSMHIYYMLFRHP